MKRLHLPLTIEDRQTLEVGEEVLLSGIIYTARDAAHKKMREEGYPFDIQDQTIYYVGASPAKPDEVIGSAGPTTSGRMDVYTPQLLDDGLACMIGKGYRNQLVKEAIIRNQAIYFVAVGGVGALLSNRIKEAKCLAYPELESEAIYQLKVEEFPVFVGIDINGNDIYEEEKL